jgi:hypothetical protein
MSSREPGRAQPGLTPLPRLEDLPASTEGYDRAKVQEAFDAFRRHVTSLQANLRVLQAAPKSAISEPSGHAVRMDALHIVRAAAEFADTIERDAQDAAAKQIGRAEQEIRADVIVQRARMGAEQLLAAAGHGDPAVHEAVDAIVRAAEATVEAQRGPQLHETSAVRSAAPAAEAPVAAPESPAPETEEDAAPVVDEAPTGETDQDDAVEAGPADEDERPGAS